MASPMLRVNVDVGGRCGLPDGAARELAHIDRGGYVRLNLEFGRFVNPGDAVVFPEAAWCDGPLTQ
jgi:hypothetical protein